MIFNSNSTTLGSSINIPMAEGYDSGVGVALALVESAQNQYEMFKAMMQVEAQEMSIMNSQSGVMQEASIVSLQEGAISGIWGKIKELFSKLVAKIKSIYHTFVAKITSLWKSDKEYVQKYEKEVRRKSGIDKMEVKWRKFTGDPVADLADKIVNPVDTYEKAYMSGDVNSGMHDSSWKNKVEEDKNKSRKMPDGYEKADSSERQEYYIKQLGLNLSDASTLKEDVIEHYLEDESTEELKDCMSIITIITNLKDRSKTLRALNKTNRDTTKKIEKIIKAADKYANAVGKNEARDGYSTPAPEASNGSKTKDQMIAERVKGANVAYEYAIAMQTVVLNLISAQLEIEKVIYKQEKAAFVKAITINPKKLEESAVYADAIAEAAAQEVTDVIDRALSKEELSKICNASKDVMDGDVSDDPDKLTYGPDSYTDNMSYVPTKGTIDTNIDSKSEAAFFGSSLY